MPATSVSINLLGDQDLSHTPHGRIIRWALSYGRYIMIGTEIVVLIAFISRFSLDRKLTDLRDEIGQKQAILEANLEFENEFRALQSDLSQIKTLMGKQRKPVDLLFLVQSLLPSDVSLESFEWSEDKLAVKATAGTSEGFAQLLANISATKELANVELSDIKKVPIEGIRFKINAQEKPKATGTKGK